MVLGNMIYLIMKLRNLLILAVVLSSCTKEFADKNEETIKYANRISVPAKVDLSCPPVADQGNEGSCVAWATTYYARSIEQYYKTGATSYSNNANVFSTEYVYNQTKVSCEGGVSIQKCLDLLKLQGVCLYSSMANIDGDCSTQPNSSQISEAANYKIDGYSKILSTDRTTINQYERYCV